LSEIDCEGVLREIEAFVDGEVGGDLYEEIQGHLEECEPCFLRADFRQRLKGILSSKCRDERVPEQLADRIRSLIDSAEAE
jgi:anti-sigma factor (TIGR02949 family)